MKTNEIIQINRAYWDENADSWFGTTALPTYGVNFVTEDELHLFGDVTDKKMLEICCGSGHSLKYHADRNAGELWGVDISHKQIENAQKYLNDNGFSANFICSPMEAELCIPTDYFDFVYSIYGIGWTTDLDGTFMKIASYLKKGGIFIFSWNHTLTHCVGRSPDQRYNVLENGKLIFSRSYFDESYFTIPIDGSEIVLCNRKISTYVNALAKAGFVIEKMVEQTDSDTLNSVEEDNAKIEKAKMLPLSFCFKAKKL